MTNFKEQKIEINNTHKAYEVSIMSSWQPHFFRGVIETRRKNSHECAIIIQ